MVVLGAAALWWCFAVEFTRDLILFGAGANRRQKIKSVIGDAKMDAGEANM